MERLLCNNRYVHIQPTAVENQSPVTTYNQFKQESCKESRTDTRPKPLCSDSHTYFRGVRQM